MGRSLVLNVDAWGAIVSAETAEQLGAAGPVSDIPAGQRRRLPPFTRDVLRCALPLLRDAPETPVVFSGTHGDLESTVKLLSDLAQGELLSPALFALSVHNAPPGALSLCATPAGDHTAIAGGDAALSAGLTECYARIATGETQSVLLIHAEERLPEIYANLDETAPGIFLAMRVTAATDGAAAIVGNHRAGAAALAHALQAGATQLTFTPPHLQARAA